MNLDDFHRSLQQSTLPASLGNALGALWEDARGNWEAAHDLAQREKSADGSWVHAYLHRKEGDQSNAEYWYRRVGREPHNGTSEEEWKDITRTLLGE